jgi:hypothetical protein
MKTIKKRKINLDKPMTDSEFFLLSADELVKLGEKLSKAPAIPNDPIMDARLERALKRPAIRRGPGRPKVGQGATKVLISIEKGLLAKADRFAKTHKMGRSELIAKALSQVLLAA